MRVVALLLVLAAAACAQAGSVDVKASFGWTGFVDEGSQNHTLVGGSFRYYITRKLSVEPELQYLYLSANHHDIVFLPSVAYDFRTGRVRPYVTAGYGVMSTTQKFSGGGGFTNRNGFLSGGFGVKFYPAERFFVAPEFRIGTELHARLSVGVGYSWPR